MQDTVLDPDLEKHLAHFGIAMKEMKKTEMSMVEMEIDLSRRWEYSTIQEEGQKLVPIYGPGYTGMINLGNTCYMNTALQTLTLVPGMVEIYAKHADAIFEHCSGSPVDDFNVQMAKVISGLQSGDYSSKPLDDTSKGQGISPFSFWSNVTRGNAEFSSKRQQDVEEFMLYLFEKLEVNHSVLKAISSDDLVTSWRFKVEERTCCTVSGIVSYKTRPETILSVPVPRDEAVNLEEHRIYMSRCENEKAAGRTVPPEQAVRLKVPLLACIHAFAEPEFITESRSPFTNENTVLQKEYHFSTFPDWLWIHVSVKKYTISENMQAEKLDVTLDVPDELDLSDMAAKGPQPGEKVFTTADDSLKHFEASSQALGQLIEMGFNEVDSKKALFKAANDPSSAIQFLLSDDLHSTPALPAEGSMSDDAENVKCNDGPGRYRLRGFISHMGSSVHSGHYVCHLLKDNHWVIFNDEKVALSEKPPKEMAHIFLYQRIEDITDERL
ncbi:unnamed protein product [Soboliphyme baturini]|uniref:ubiquitinyl hydrolase 1 n=1 Tax=Soboliphyme baturini TaxID=241478 RepID=A0A183IXT6_9BILA|nr:unnamed protein product [Soboliphyme baturini]